jgi:gluconolactonase
MRWLEDDGHVSVFRANSNYANGNTRDREGRPIICEHDARRVTRTEPDGAITVLIDSFQGKKLNAPHDVVVASDGAIWFTIFGNYEGHLRSSPSFFAPLGALRPLPTASRSKAKFRV